MNEGHIEAMNRRSAHRGPDHFGVHNIQTKSQQLFFGLNRLKIQDLSDDANQPMISEDRQHIICFNGEIYNFKDLRKELELAGHRFRTQSDTEVLLHFLMEYKGHQLERLNGMYAFVYYNVSNDKLLLARDRFGMKPLYYYQDDERLIVSSEIQSFFAAGVSKELNEQQIPNYLAHRFPAAPETLYKNIFEVEKGVVIEYKNGERLINPVDNPTFKTDNSNLEELLQKSIEQHLISDASTGLLLSGGIDSSLILALSAEQGNKLPCLSIGNSDNSFGTEDLKYAESAAKQFGCDHQIVNVSSDILHRFDEYVGKMDQPIADGAGMLTWLITEQSQQKVLLSGAGADELFAGYSRHYAFDKYLRWFHKNPLLYSSLKLVGGKLPEGKNSRFRKKFRHINMLSEKVSKSVDETYHNLIKVRFPYGLQNQDLINQPHLSGKSRNELLTSMLQHEQQHYLAQDVLKITDHSSMQNSVEVRLPFLDNELSHYVNQLGGRQQLKHGRKWMLKDIAGKYLPKSVIDRPKEGFGMPFGEWIKTGNFANITDLLSSQKSTIYEYVDYEISRQFISSHQNGKKDYSNEIWSLAVLAHWMEKEFS